MVGAESAQRRLQLGHQAAPRHVDPALTARPRDPGLGADDEVVTRGPRRPAGRRGGLRVAAAVAEGRIDEVAARLDEGAQVVAGLVAIDGVAQSMVRGQAG